MTPENQYPDESPQLLFRSYLIHHIGQEAYDALMGDLIVTPEAAKDMITIHGQIS